MAKSELRVKSLGLCVCDTVDARRFYDEDEFKGERIKVEKLGEL